MMKLTSLEFAYCLGRDEDKSLLHLSSEVIDRAMELLGYGLAPSEVMRRINAVSTDYADYCNRRISITPNDMAIIKKRYDRGNASRITRLFVM